MSKGTKYDAAKDLEHAIDLISRGVGEIGLIQKNVIPNQVERIVECLSLRDSVVTLNLSHNMVGDAGTLMIAEFLKSSNALENLELGFNTIGPKGATALAEALLENNSLMRLALDKNEINDQGALALAHNLNESSLTYLKIDRNPITEESLNAFLKELESNKRMIYLNAESGFVLNDDYYKRINQILKKNKELRASNEKKKQNLLKELSKSSGKGKWLRCKLMVVGQGRTGKTATVRSLLKLPFDGSLESTVVGCVTDVDVLPQKWGENEVKIDNSTSVALQIAEERFNTGYGVKKKKTKGEIAAAIKAEANIISRISHDEFRNMPPEKKQVIRDMRMRVKAREDGKNLPPMFAEIEMFEVKNDTEKEATPQTSFNSVMAPEEFRKLTRKEQMELRKQWKLQKEAEKNDKTTAVLDENVISTLSSDGKAFKNTTKHLPKLRFSIWDLGGQECFHTVHHLFLTNQAFYIVLIDLRKLAFEEEVPSETMEHLQYWGKSLRVHCPGAKVFVVGSFLDAVVADLLDYKLEDVLGNVEKLLLGLKESVFKGLEIIPNEKTGRSFFEVDNKSSEGVQILRRTIEEVASKEDFVNQLVDLKWLRVLDVVMADEKNRFIERKRNMARDAYRDRNPNPTNIPRTPEVNVNLRGLNLNGNGNIRDYVRDRIEERRGNDPYGDNIFRTRPQNIPANGVEEPPIDENVPVPVNQGQDDLQIQIEPPAEQPLPEPVNLQPPEQNPNPPQAPTNNTTIAALNQMRFRLFNNQLTAGDRQDLVNIIEYYVQMNPHNLLPGDAALGQERARHPNGLVRNIFRPVEPREEENNNNNAGFTVRRQMEALLTTDDYRGWVSVAKIKEEAQKFGIVTDQEISNMLKLFHKMGALFYLDHTQSLKEIVTVDIMWLISAVGKVIRDPTLHREKLDDEELERRRLQKEVEDMFDTGIISLDLLEYFWGKDEQVGFLIDLMKKALLLNDFPWKESSFLAPSLLPYKPENIAMLNDEMNRAENQFKAQFKFQEDLLPDGIFERILTSLIVLCATEKQGLFDDPVEPKFEKSICKIQFGAKNLLFLAMKEGSLHLCFSNGEMTDKNVKMINALLGKIRSDLTLVNFVWETLVEVDGEFIPLQTAQTKKVKPWSQENVNIKGLNLTSFLEDM